MRCDHDCVLTLRSISSVEQKQMIFIKPIYLSWPYHMCPFTHAPSASHSFLCTQAYPLDLILLVTVCDVTIQPRGMQGFRKCPFYNLLQHTYHALPLIIPPKLACYWYIQVPGTGVIMIFTRNYKTTVRPSTGTIN